MFSGCLVAVSDDATAREAILAGARGVISVTGNIVSGAIAAMVAAAVRCDQESAGRLDAPLAALHRALFLEANPIAVKWALAHAGLIESEIRLPLTELSAVHRPAILVALREGSSPVNSIELIDRNARSTLPPAAVAVGPPRRSASQASS